MALQDPNTVLGGLNVIVDFLMRYAVTLAAVGAVTVGLQEAYKKVFASLARFHRKAVCRWLANESPGAERGMQLMATLSAGHYGMGDGLPAGYDAKKAYAQLLHLCTGMPLQAQGLPLDLKGGALKRSIAFALFELETAKMMSQLQEAADAALNQPARYGEWFMFITRGCSAPDLEAWHKVLKGGADAATRDQGAAAYARIRLLVRRQLDGFQTVTAYRWREWNQWWAWLVGGVLMLVAQIVQAPVTSGRWLEMLVVSLAGGLLAPVAKDLVDALGNAKKFK